MLALRDLNIPSLPVHDSLIVTTDHEQTAREALFKLYTITTGAVPRITTTPPPPLLYRRSSHPRPSEGERER